MHNIAPNECYAKSRAGWLASLREKGDRSIIPIEIEAELALVTANRELIARFEKKIQATLARVWGENELTPD